LVFSGPIRHSRFGFRCWFLRGRSEIIAVARTTGTPSLKRTSATGNSNSKVTALRTISISSSPTHHTPSLCDNGLEDDINDTRDTDCDDCLFDNSHENDDASARRVRSKVSQEYRTTSPKVESRSYSLLEKQLYLRTTNKLRAGSSAALRSTLQLHELREVRSKHLQASLRATVGSLHNTAGTTQSSQLCSTGSNL